MPVRIVSQPFQYPIINASTSAMKVPTHRFRLNS